MQHREPTISGRGLPEKIFRVTLKSMNDHGQCTPRLLVSTLDNVYFTCTNSRREIRTGDFLHVVASRRHTQIYKPSSIRLGLVGRGAADPFAVE